MLDLTKYNFLKKECDKILGTKPNIYFLANNSLNVIKGHPYHLKIFTNSIISCFKNLISNFVKFIFEILFSIFKFTNLKKTKKKVDCLLISNLVNTNSINSKDYIYGDLEKKLKKKISVHKIFVNHTNLNTGEIRKRINNKKNISIIGFENANIFYNIKTFLVLFFYFFLFLIKSIINFNKLYFVISVSFLNFSTKKNINLMKNFSEIIKVINFKTILMPYEGYSWERLVLSECKKKANKKRYGYNFSGFIKNQHSILRKLDKKYEPDIIFTPGKYSLKKFKNSSIPTKIFGSNRFFIKKTPNVYVEKRNNIIVLPEGIMSECRKIFSFSVEIARKFPNFNFIWRLHPSMNFLQVLKNLSHYGTYQLPKNIIISKKSFIKDIYRSKIAIYRGSTSIITALQNGVYPVYFNNNENLSIDPIYEMNCWKSSINNFNDFKKLIDRDFFYKIEKSKDKNRAKDFAKNYFGKMNYSNLIKLLTKN